ncbi:hypothetical protein GCM10011352_10960 [Marinobacterium zhoushanense]|uniref:DUF349 domain-containing protein n=1 Tax=Marinobacterium zhoushanense TaxID=1679163 RepID=A0ABQ1K527_9GAMM|nr:DUF349 domain-containing protein [Marinobacterium zhoushanense]GGB86891.1 hypothetical protein GCM10011352_10960 [Marinobacterium zhoushanense]
MFVNLFKPKWRHSSAAVRASAVARLRKDHPGHIDILRQLLLDDNSSEVRRAALDRVDDPELLIQALVSEQDQQLRLHAACAIANYLEPLPEQEQRNWLERLPDTASLAALVLCDAGNQVQYVALSLIDDQTTLLTLALQGAIAQLRRSAAERITQPELLDTLCRESRGSDKTVHRIARDMLQAYKEQEREQQALEQKQRELIATLNALVNGLDHQHFQARFDVINREWEQLPSSSLLEPEFQTLAQRARAFIAQQQAEREQQEAKARAAAAHRDACVQLEQEIDGALTQDIEVSALQSLCDRVQSLEQQGPLTDGLNRRLKQAQHCRSALEQLQQHQDQLQSLLQQPLEQLDKGSINNLLHAIRWPEKLAKPDLLVQAEKLLKAIDKRRQEKREHSDRLASQLEGNLDALEQAISQGEIRVAVRCQDQATDQLQRLNGTTAPQLEKRYKSLIAQLQEMKDWQGFAINGKKEELCDRMEALIDADLPPQQLADQIRSLQQEWKSLDAGACVHSQKLWQRFRTAAEAAYSPCEAHFSTQRQLREQNLKQREEICHQLGQLLDSIDWDKADWPAIERICHTAKREWKQFSPVDRAPGKAVQSSFNQLIRNLDQRLRNWHQQCAEAKRQLILRAAELAEAEDLRAAAEEAKALQRHWKAIGPAFRSEERALWQEFRAHCDTIFARLKDDPTPPATQIMLEQSPAPMKEAELSRFNSCAEMLTKAEAAMLEGDAELIDRILDTVRGSVKSLPLPWRAAMLERADVVERTVESTEELEQQLADSEQRLRELCIRLEILLGQPTPDEDQAKRMEYQMRRLQQALAEQNQNPATGDVIQLDLEWKTLPYSGVFPELRQRFEQLKQRTTC